MRRDAIMEGTYVLHERVFAVKETETPRRNVNPHPYRETEKKRCRNRRASRRAIAADAGFAGVGRRGLP